MRFAAARAIQCDTWAVNSNLSQTPIATPIATPTVVVDLDAFAHNIGVLRTVVPEADAMAIVKANAYGHGHSEMALAAVDAGIHWLGVAQVQEALEVRQALDDAGIPRDDVHILTWLLEDGGLISKAILADLDLSVSTTQMLAMIASEAQAQAQAQGLEGGPARIHVKADTGMSRGGATLADLPALASAVRMSADAGRVELVGLWSHCARADDPSEDGQAATAQQVAEFERATQILADAGLTPQIRHLGATAATLWHPETHFDMVRLGIGMYGLSPDHTVATGAELGLKPVMRLEAPLQQVKVVEAGRPVSYGGTWVAPTRRWLGLVPIGYGDGILRASSNSGPVTVLPEGGDPIMTHVVGRMCMDQFVVDLGPADSDLHAEPPARAGDIAVLWGDPATRVPSAEDWADACGTISYEVVTRLSERLPRRYLKEGTLD